MSKGKIVTVEFKKQIVSLYNNDKSPSYILKEYEIVRTTLYKWLSEYNNSGSLKLKKIERMKKINN